MNESSSQQPGPEAPGNPGGFFPWVRGLGVVRDPNNRWLAGVASGIARRARVDPLVIRA
ncbi:MAG: PspC domain-containing protein, partial [Microbacteriaceae bacterium]